MVALQVLKVILVVLFLKICPIQQLVRLKKEGLHHLFCIVVINLRFANPVFVKCKSMVDSKKKKKMKSQHKIV